MENEKKKVKKIVVGFWFRLLSDIIDALILGAFGFLIALPLKNVFYSMGENGLFLGLLITFLYTGFLQSHVGKGQSLAKKFLRIQVLSIDGSYLSLGKSFFRYSVIAMIFYNAWIWTALTSILPFLNNFIFQSFYTYFIIFLFLGVAILMAFHPLKRGLHDLLANSFVIRKGLYDQGLVHSLTNRSKIKRAFIIWGGCCLVLIFFSFYMLAKQDKMMSLIDEMTKIQQQIESETIFANVSIRHNYHTFTNSEGVTTNTTSINIFPFLYKKDFDNKILKLIRDFYGYIRQSCSHHTVWYGTLLY